MFKMFDSWGCNRAMTLIEVLLVVSLVSMISLSLYKGLTTGIRVWERSRVSVKEEDIALFFDKLTKDLHNSYLFTTIVFEGSESRLAFPSIVLTAAGDELGLKEGELSEQLGRVEYFIDLLDKTIYRRQYNYAQAISQSGPAAIALVPEVESLKFRYYYVTESKELYNSDFLDAIPMGLEVEVQFSDGAGQRSLKKYIDIPIGG